MRKKPIKNNPYILSYFTLALLCCIGLSILFLYINIQNMRKAEITNNKQQIELISNDLDVQVKTFKKINVKIQANTLYRPSKYEENKYNETLLLEDFSQYRNYSPLECEYLLYYKNTNSLFSSNGTTVTLQVWLDNWHTTEQESLLDFLNTTDQFGVLPLPSTESFLIRYPLSGMAKAGSYNAALFILIQNAELLERFQIVSGGLSGDFALCSGDQIILSTSESFDYASSELLSKTTVDNGFTIHFLSSSQNSFSQTIMPLQLSLIFVVVIFILFVSTLFANHSYKPILQLSEKYRDILPENSEALFSNELDNLNYMMDTVIKHNTTANRMLEQKQTQLRNQLLLLILSGKASFEIHPYLQQLGMPFPGPWYFIVSIRLYQTPNDANISFEELQKMIEAIGKPEEDKHIYCVIEPEENLLNCICSISETLQKEEMLDEIFSITDNFDNKIIVGCGCEYSNIQNLYASYLDARDKVHIAEKNRSSTLNANTLADASLLSTLRTALINEKLEPAKEALEQYILHIQDEAPSMLMQQYLFSNFLNEMNRLYKENQLELPRQYLSLLLSAKKISQFRQAAQEIFMDFSTQLSAQRELFLENSSNQVIQYMKEHFSDYDMSIEKVMQHTNTSAAFVRNVIRENLGMSYIDYLIHLRIEYAKKLLIVDNLTVTETCQQVGYSKVSYFIKIFKAHTGDTPTNTNM